MTTPHSFHKLKDCDRCQFYTGSPLLACTVHPMGVEDGHCPDFREDHTWRWKQFLQLDWIASGENDPDERWEPEGASYYNREQIISPEQRWNDDQRLELLDWLPCLREGAQRARGHWSRLIHHQFIGIVLTVAGRMTQCSTF